MVKYPTTTNVALWHVNHTTSDQRFCYHYQLCFLVKFEAKLSGNLTNLMKLQNLQHSSGVNVKSPTGFISLSTWVKKCNSGLIFMSAKSFQALSVSLDLSIPKIVLGKLSHIFFSTCMTLRLCLNSSEVQYSSSKNMFFFL